MILFRNCLCVSTPRKEDLYGADILVENNRIAKIGTNLTVSEGTRIIDAKGCVAIPGLVNTHHHFYQTLTRNLKGAQDAKLFNWLVYLYEVWKGIDEDSVYWSSRLAMAELIKTGCTCTTDHHYLYPKGFTKDIPEIQFGAAKELGIRFAPTRGSMSLSKKDGGLPPDTVVQDDDEILSQCEETIKRFHDSAPDSMQKVALAPCSPFSVTEELMKKTAVLARKYGCRLHTHLAETSDEDAFCVKMYGRRPLKLMQDTGFTGSDVWYAHGIFFNDEELKILAETQTGVAHCPSSNMRLGSGICRVREMIDMGIPVGLAVDGSASNDSSDMLGEVRQALLLQRVKYGSKGLTAKEAYTLATENGAKILGFPDAGKLEEGALADIALFNVEKLAYAGALSDPSAALIFTGYDHSAYYVMVNGKLVLEKGILTGMDEETIRINADIASRKLLNRARS